MGLWARFKMLFQAKASKALDRAENPADTLDYSYQRQLEMLQKVKRGVAEVVTAKKRLQMQTDKLEASVVKLDGQARQAMAGGREDLARTALERKILIQGQLQDLDQQVAALEAQQQQLVDQERAMSAKVEAFRTQKEVIKAQYSAAEAQVRIGEATTGLSSEMSGRRRGDRARPGQDRGAQGAGVRGRGAGRHRRARRPERAGVERPRPADRGADRRHPGGERDGAAEGRGGRTGGPARASCRPARRRPMGRRPSRRRHRSSSPSSTDSGGGVAGRTYVRYDARVGAEPIRWDVGGERHGQLPLFGPEHRELASVEYLPGGRPADRQPRSRAVADAVPVHDQRLPRLPPRVHVLLRPADPRVPGDGHRRGLRAADRGQGQRRRAAAPGARRPVAGRARRSRWARTPIPTSRRRAATG